MVYRDKQGRFINLFQWFEFVAQELIDWGWIGAIERLCNACHARAALWCQRGRRDEARRWLDRAEKLEALKNA